MAEFEYGFSDSVLSNIHTLPGKDRQLAVIQKFKEVCVREAVEFRIPPSIKLAQLMLESGSMKNPKNNVLFGIKSKSGGVKVNTHEYKNDEKIYKKDTFKNAPTPWQAIRDHSLYIVNSKRKIKEDGKIKTIQRYGSLLELDLTNYQAWAYGLKASGYATNPMYADKLISLIERYELYKLDRVAALLANN